MLPHPTTPSVSEPFGKQAQHLHHQLSVAPQNHNNTTYMASANGYRQETVIDIKKPVSFTGGLEFSGLTYTVTKKKKVEGKWSSEEVDLLHDITGYAPKGCITAVMGPSGAGKSTFLDGLAGRIASGSLKGRVSLDGTTVSTSLIKRTSAYIMQEDRLFPMLTVYETLMFAADFRLGPLSIADKRQRVDKLIEQLGLSVSAFNLSNNHLPRILIGKITSAFHPLIIDN